MPSVIIYTSTQACPPALDLALALRANGHQLRTLGELPTPRRARLASLCLELAAWQQDERTLRWTLAQYAEGLRPPDADREDALRADLEMTLGRLRTVTATLHTLTGQSHE